MLRSPASPQTVIVLFGGEPEIAAGVKSCSIGFETESLGCREVCNEARVSYRQQCSQGEVVVNAISRRSCAGQTNVAHLGTRELLRIRMVVLNQERNRHGSETGHIWSRIVVSDFHVVLRPGVNFRIAC